MALAEFSAVDKIRVTGKDRVAVLHNILTQDIQNLRPGQEAPAALLSSAGKILMFMEVAAYPDSVVLTVEKGQGAKTMALIDKFVIAEDVQSEALLPPEPLALDPDAEARRIEAGSLRYGVDMDENTVLPETGLEKMAASGTKGCYPGQEVVARIETYGGLHRKIRGLIFEGTTIPGPGSKIYAEDGTEIGWITSASFSKRLGKAIGIGVLAKGYFEKDLKVTVDSAGVRMMAKTAAWPLYRAV